MRRERDLLPGAVPKTLDFLPVGVIKSVKSGAFGREEEEE